MRSSVFGALVAAAALTATACGSTTAPRHSVVLVVIDTLRADHLVTYGYERDTSPAIDARAQGAAVFENAFSTAPWTLPAMGSMFTGRLPTRHGAGIVVRDTAGLPSREDLDALVNHADLLFYQLDGELPTLAERMSAAGYTTAAIVNNSFLAPEFGLDRGFDHYDIARSGKVERPADTAVDLAIAWLERHHAAAEPAPFFLFLHVFDPHMPYAAPSPFKGAYTDALLDPAEGASPDVLDIMALRDRTRAGGDDGRRSTAIQQALYDEEIAFADRELGRFFDALDARGLAATTRVMITSDHGEAFFEHGKFEHGNSVFNEQIRVPLIVWGPDVRPGRYELPVSLVDVMPTLLAAHGIETPPEAEGVSLWSILTSGPPAAKASPVPFDRLLFAERTLYGDERKAVIGWPWKTWVNVDDSYAELFNLVDDPLERNDLRAVEEDRYYTLLAALQETMAAAGRQQAAQTVILDEKMLEDLRALGYIR